MAIPHASTPSQTTSEIDASSTARRDLTPSPSRETYLRQHTVGSIVRTSFRIYAHEIKTVLLVYTAPTLPLSLLAAHAMASKAYVLAIIAFALMLLVTLFSYAALSVAISDVTLGERASASRAYGRTSGRMAARLLATNLLTMLLVSIGFLLLVVPGVVLMLRYLFAPIVVVLEQQTGRAALKRSAALAKGMNWRNLGAGALVYVVATMIMLAVAAPVGVVIGLTDASADWLIRSLDPALACLFVQPLLLITLTLLYYDLRVRKEGYDVRALAEDLRR